jgi:hypothetical protein
MPSDLEGNLIEGGLTPAAAKLISNAIDNAATGRLSTSRQLEDATPSSRMRVIDSDTRRYVLTNLDYPSSAKRNDRFAPRYLSHPYQDSQPASSNPTLATPGVKPGKFMAVSSKTENQVSQSEVGLNVQQMGGQHARLNPGTGAIEAVPISLRFEPEGLLEGEVIEEAGQTVIKIRVVSNALRGLLKKRIGAYTSISTSVGAGTLRIDNTIVGDGEAFVILPE